MEIRHWYRCDICSQRYSPQQVQALLDLENARAGISAATGRSGPAPSALLCRKKGCGGTLRPTDVLDRNDRG